MPTLIESQLTSLSTEDFVAGVFAEHNFFQSGERIWIARAPGRLDFIGGNADYTGGLVLQSVLREAVWAAVQPRRDDEIRIFNPGAAEFGWSTSFNLRVSDLDLADPKMVGRLCGQDQRTRWGSYVLGGLYLLRTRFGWGDCGGANIFIASDLPPNKGVSSSAALEIAVLKAVSASQHISLEGIALATAAQWVENVIAGSACGIMDQAAIVLGQQNCLLPLLCQPCEPGQLVSIPPGMRVWGIDSMVSRSTTGAAYEIARAAAFIGYKLICDREGIPAAKDADSPISRWTDPRWNGYLSNLPLAEFYATYESNLPEFLSGEIFLSHGGEHLDPFTTVRPDALHPVRAAVRYAVEEHNRVHTVRALIEACAHGSAANALQSIGEVLCQSHAAYGECGLGSPDCDELVERALDAGFPGARMTGGGSGGVVAILGRPEDEEAIRKLAAEYASGRNAEPHIFCGSSEGVDANGVITLNH